MAQVRKAFRKHVYRRSDEHIFSAKLTVFFFERRNIYNVMTRSHHNDAVFVQILKKTRF